MPGKIITIISGIFIVMLGIFIVSKYQLWFTKHRFKLLSIFMVLGIIIYTIGYLAKTPFSYLSSAFMAIFSTGRMFVFENDISSFENEVAKIPFYNIIFGLIMTFSMLTTGMIVLSFIGYRSLCKIQLEFVRFFAKKKSMYIFTKLNKKVLMLAADIKNHNKKSIILFFVDDINETDENKNLEKTSSQNGFIVLPIYNKYSANKLCNHFMGNKITIFACSDDDNANVEFVNDFTTYLKVSKKTNPNIKIYAFIKNNEYEDVFYKECFADIDIHIVDENDLSSRQLFDKFTLISCMGEPKALTVCVIGFSEISENLYKNIIYLGQCDGVKLKLILMDEKINDKTAQFFNKNLEIRKCASFECLAINPNSVQFFEYFNNNVQNINCIIIANDNIETATEISRICSYIDHKVKICLHVKDYVKYSFLFETHFLKNVITFGSIKDIFTESIIINETLDQMARGFHNYYAQLYKDTRLWVEVSLFEKQSNRALALHVQSKLYSIGLKITKENNDTRLFDEKINDKSVLETLAKEEHLRWNAFSFANGWRTMNNIQDRVKNKNSITKIHSCLVDWDDIDSVSKNFNKDYKEMDRHLIQNIGNIVKSVGYGIEKIEK